MTGIETLSEHASFGGRVSFHEHHSESCRATMRFSVYRPPGADEGPVPALYFLAGLTSTEANFMEKGGAQRLASELGLMLVAPDTSPRGLDLPGEHDDWDFGSGAGFYVDATEEPWARHYRTYTYVTEELPRIVESGFGASPDGRGIFGHSMGGHGALTIALKDPGRYRSVSAFAPIVAPARVPWGEKAFSGYLGDDREAWKPHDATEIIASGGAFPDGRTILVDQGTADGFFEGQLAPGVFERTCERAGQPLDFRYREGYDHNYYFISTFMEDHLRHHAAALL